MSRPNVLILTDSSGSGLEEHLKKNVSAFWTSYDVRVIAVKGAKLHDYFPTGKDPTYGHVYGTWW